jgi:hypothetical protein
VWLFVGGLCMAQPGVPYAAPRALTDDHQNPAPDSQARTCKERFRALIKARYPNLFTKPVQGVPIVTVLFDSHGEILRADLEISSRPQSDFSVSEANFSRSGALAVDLQYIGAASIDLPANTVFIAYASVGSPGA